MQKDRSCGSSTSTADATPTILHGLKSKKLARDDENNDDVNLEDDKESTLDTDSSSASSSSEDSDDEGREFRRGSDDDTHSECSDEESDEDITATRIIPSVEWRRTCLSLWQLPHGESGEDAALIWELRRAVYNADQVKLFLYFLFFNTFR